MTQPLDYEVPSKETSARLSRWGKGFLAVAGTFLFNGVGHLLAGRPRRAAGWAVGTLVLIAATVTTMLTPALQPALFVLVPLWGVLSLVCLVDAFLCGRRSTRAMLNTPALRYLAGLGLVALTGVGQPTVRLARLFLFPRVEAYVMPTGSMSPTIKPDDRFLVLKTHWSIRRWDLVVFHPPLAQAANENWIKRVVGLPGEKIEIIDGVVNVNGQAVTPPESIGPYVRPGHFRIYDSNGGEGNPIFLKEGEYFVLGDNSPISGDSRVWAEAAPGHQPGALPADHIVGRVTAIYWPLNRCRRFPN